MNTPVRSLEEIIASGKFSPSIEAGIKKAQSLDRSDPDYNARLVKRMQLQERVMQIMAENQLDALIYPHQQRLVVQISERQVGRNGVVASVTGFPVITVPGGFSKPTATAPIGVPVGIECRPSVERADADPHRLRVRAGDAVSPAAAHHSAAEVSDV